jgi:hypothetical protein
VEFADQAVATEARRAGEPRPVRAFGTTLCVAAVGAGVVLLAVGAPVPSPGPVLLLALVAALCVNRFALFPTEHAATAEVAVLVAAVVGFRDDAVLLGPLFVALLVGPLDALHWEQRSFVRMAYNSGNRGLSVLAASGVFVACRDALGTSPADWCIIVVVTGTALFVVDDFLLSTALLRLAGEPSGAALRHVLEVDALTLPLGWYGGATALLLGGFGWWAVALALVPVAFVPELVVARARRGAASLRDVAVVLAVVAVLATVAIVTSVPGPATLAVLAATGVLAGAELVVDRSTLLPPLIALAVVGAVVVDRDHAGFAAALVATLAVTISWSAAARASRAHLLAALTTALGASLLAATVATSIPHTISGLASGALLAGFAFEAVGVIAGTDRRRARGALVWTAPLVAATVAWALVGRAMGAAGAAVFAVAATMSVAGAVRWGSPAWRSRVLQRALGRRPARRLASMLLTLGAGAIASAVVAVTRQDHAFAVAWAWVSVGLSESAAAVVALGVRQWRFAPHPRRLGLASLLGVSALLLTVVPNLLIDGSVLGVVLVAALTTLVAVVGRQPAARARAAAHERAEVARG